MAVHDRIALICEGAPVDASIDLVLEQRLGGRNE
jgi:hypothetical protein